MQSITCRSADAVDLGFMQSVDLAVALRPLVQQTADQHEGVQNPLAKRTAGDLIQLTADVTQDAAGVSLQHFQRLTHALELPGMGVAPDL